MNIKEITLNEIDDLVVLFNKYMVFYEQESNPSKYKKYLSERLTNKEATVFIAYDEHNNAMGFVLNYFSFSSVSLCKKIILNDLYVDSNYRKKGIAEKLINRVFNLAKDRKALKVDLMTAKDNYNAQALYEKIGFVKDTEYYSYSFKI